MGTPRASASVDQMRNVQRTASCGEGSVSVCAIDRGKITGVAGSSRSNTANAGAIIMIGAVLDVHADVGWVGFCRGMTHDFIVAQHLVHLAGDGAGMLIVQICAGVWGTRMSPKTNKTAIRSRLITRIGST